MSTADEAKWRRLIASMAPQWTKMILFDNFGFAIARGDTSDLGDHAVDLLVYARRQRELDGYRPSFYYLDIALFPERFEHVYDEFRQSLPEFSD
jgi:hypothetical protein